MVSRHDMTMTGDAMHRFIADLYPICRSITGDGVRQTLDIIRARIPLSVREVPTGTPVFDWTVPREWNVKDAYIKNARGERVVDFQRSNLHVLNYSAPVKKTVSLAELKGHLYSLPDHPDWIPYRTSYYQERWGFCLSHHDLLRLTDDAYEVCIDSSLAPGALTYGEYYLRGERAEEVLFSTHVCHPSLCNETSRASRLRCFWRSTCSFCRGDTRTGFCSSRAQSGRSPGSRSTSPARRRSRTAWCWRAWATRGTRPIKRAGAETARSIARSRMC